MSLFLISACSAPPPATNDVLRVASFGNSHGLAAKRAAQLICARQGQQLNPAAYGHFTAGAWEFDGGCLANP